MRSVLIAAAFAFGTLTIAGQVFTVYQQGVACTQQVGATAAFIALDPHSTIPLVGASGAISGILAAYLMLRPCAKVSVFILRVVVRIRALWVIGAWILLQIISILNQPNDGVAYTAHGGGLIAGAVLFLLMRPAGVHLFTCVEQPGESEGTV